MKTIFEKIIDNEIPSHKIYEDDNFIAILDAFPKALGHTLVIPKAVKENILLEDLETQSALISLSTKLATRIKDKLNADGIKILTNINKAAGQEVFHTHVHIIPFYDTETNIEVNEEIANKIKED